MPSIFVFGLLPDSSGKTVVSTALARALSDEGVNVGVFKPRSGHNTWYQHETFLKCKAEGRLFCEDITRLREASRCPLPYEVLNPVDALMSPLNVQTFLERKQIRRMYLLEQETYLHLVAERYTSVKNGKTEDTLLLNERSTDTLISNDQEYLADLKEKATEVIPVRSLNEWNSLFKKLATPSICSCYQVVKQQTQTLIIEGFNDAVAPEPRLLPDIDLVIGVAPGIALIYDSEEFRRVIRTTEKISKDPRTLTARETVRFLKPSRTLRIPPQPHECLLDYEKLTRRLQDVIDHVGSCLK